MLVMRSSTKRLRTRFRASLNFSFVGRVGIDLLDLAVEAFEDRDAVADLFEREEVSFESVIEVGGVVGDFVGQVDELGFERRALVEKIFGEFGILFRVVVVGVLDDAFADFEGQVQAAEGGVALLEIFDDAEGVEVVVEEEAVLAHGGVESFFSGVAEGRVADVVDQRESFGEIDVEAEAPAMVREICETSSVWVRRLRKWSE